MPTSSHSWEANQYVWNDSTGTASPAVLSGDDAAFVPLVTVNSATAQSSRAPVVAAKNDDGVSTEKPPVSSKGKKRPLSVRSRWYHGLPGKSVLCKLEGCNEVCSTAYSARSRICRTHLRAKEVTISGTPQRFCHKCTKFHPLSDFTSNNHTCAMWLSRVSAKLVDGNEKKKETQQRNIGSKCTPEVTTMVTERTTTTASIEVKAATQSRRVPFELVDNSRGAEEVKTNEEVCVNDMEDADKQWSAMVGEFMSPDVAAEDFLRYLRAQNDKQGRVDAATPLPTPDSSNNNIFCEEGVRATTMPNHEDHQGHPDGGFDILRDWHHYFDLDHSQSLVQREAYDGGSNGDGGGGEVGEGGGGMNTHVSGRPFESFDANKLFSAAPAFSGTRTQTNVKRFTTRSTQTELMLSVHYKTAEPLPTNTVHGPNASSVEQVHESEQLMSTWIKIHNATPKELPSEGLVSGLSSWTHGEIPRMFSSSAQPGCTLIKMTYTTSSEERNRLMREGPGALAEKIARGPLGQLGDFTVGMGGHLGVEAAAEQFSAAERFSDNFSIETRKIIMKDGLPLAESTTQALSTGLSICSKPCICSAEQHSVIVELPCPLPAGCRLECRTRGMIVPVECTKLHNHNNNSGHFMHVLMPQTNTNGFAIFELVREDDAIPLGVPSAVLLLAEDPAVVEAVNTVLESLNHGSGQQRDHSFSPASKMNTTLSSSSIYVFGNAIIGRAPSDRVFAILCWLCGLSIEGVDSDTINPLVEKLLSLYPPKDKQEAARLLFHAVTSETLSRVMLVANLLLICQDEEAASLENDKQVMDQVGVALVPLRVEGRLVTALHTAAMLSDGDIALALLSTPGIANVSDWYSSLGSKFTPYALAEKGVRLKYSTVCDKNDVSARRLMRQLPGISVHRVLNNGTAATINMMHGAIKILGKTATPVDIIDAVFRSMAQDSEWKGGDDDADNYLGAIVNAILLDHTLSYKLAEIVVAMDGDNAIRSAPLARNFMTALRMKLQHIHFENAYDETEDEDFEHNIASNVPNAMELARHGIKSFMKLASCVIPDGNRSIFHVDESEEAREGFYQCMIGRHLGTPLLDVQTMCFATALTIIAMYKHNDFDVRKLFNWYCVPTITDFGDGSNFSQHISNWAIHHISQSGHVILSLLNVYLLRRNVKTWSEWRERLIVSHRVMVTASMFHARMNHPSGVVPHLMNGFAIRIITEMAISLISPLRVERYILVQSVSVSSIYAAIFLRVRWSWHVIYIITSLLIVTVSIASTQLWKYERNFRRQITSKHHDHNHPVSSSGAMNGQRRQVFAAAGSSPFKQNSESHSKLE